MERTHTPLSVWFRAADLVAHQPGMSDVQFQRQLGLQRYEMAFQTHYKLRVGMVRPDYDRTSGNPGEHVEVDEITSVAVPAVRDEVFTTWFSSPARSRSNNPSAEAVSTSAELGNTVVVLGSRWCQTEVPNRW